MKSASTYKLLLAYEGTRYAGWQRQPRADTIQQRLETALGRLFGQRVVTHAAGRTDAGVHARGQVVSFQAAKKIPPRVLVRALNAHLPPDIRVLRAAPAAASFHARFSALQKEYRYRIFNAAVMDPFLRAIALHEPRPLDLTAMRRLARCFVGRHDFASLAAGPQDNPAGTVRTVTRLTISKRGTLLTIAVRADGFLYRMVRSLVGALLKAGRGEAPVESLADYFRSGKRTHLVPTAPAHGLCLVKVWYRLPRAGRRRSP